MRVDVQETDVGYGNVKQYVLMENVMNIVGGYKVTIVKKKRFKYLK